MCSEDVQTVQEDGQAGRRGANLKAGLVLGRPKHQENALEKSESPSLLLFQEISARSPKKLTLRTSSTVRTSQTQSSVDLVRSISSVSNPRMELTDITCCSHWVSTQRVAGSWGEICQLQTGKRSSEGKDQGKRTGQPMYPGMGRSHDSVSVWKYFSKVMMHDAHKLRRRHSERP